MTRRGFMLDTANPILAALNGDRVAPSQQKRLVEILKDIQKLEEMCAEVRRHDQLEVVRTEVGEVRFHGTTTDEGIAAVKALNDLGAAILDRVNEQLLRSRWSNRLMVHNHTKLLRINIFNKRSDNAILIESSIFYFLNEYLPTGEINRFRTCGECKRWLFAMTDHQRYCGEKCRLRHISQSDVFKEKRRLFMRDYRRKGKEREKRERLAAKAKGR